MKGGLIAVKINNLLKRDKVLNKKGKFLTTTKSQVNRILREKYGKPLKVRKVFYLNEISKKMRLEFCQKIVQMSLEGKNIFFTYETKVDTTPYTKGESIRISKNIKNKIKKEMKKVIRKLTEKQKNMNHQLS